MNSTSAWLVVARKELGDGLRNRWIWLVSAVFAVSVLAIAAFGTAPVGVATVRANQALIASLTNLTIYLVPLLALVLGCGAVIDEKRRGTLDLILVYPLSAGEYFAGTFAGFALALAVATVSGFGVAGVAIGAWSGIDARAYTLLIGLAVILGLVFLGLSFLVSLLSRERGRAVISSVFVWICSVLVFDLVLIGVLIVSKGRVPARAFAVLMLCNPTDVFRILCFKWMQGAASPLGLAAAMPFLPPAAIVSGVLAAWVIAPLAVSYAVFRRRVANDALI